MNLNLEAYIQRKMSRFLDGPETFQFNALRNGTQRKYRSSSLALFAWFIGITRLFLSPVGFYLLPVVAMLVAYASVAMDAPMRFMVLIFLAVFLVELSLGFWYRPRVDLVRLMPDRVTRLTIRPGSRSKSMPRSACCLPGRKSSSKAWFMRSGAGAT